MNAAGIARVRACFENAETIYPIGYPENRNVSSLGYSPVSLPQMPPPQAPASKVLTDE